MLQFQNMTVAEIVATNIRYADIFKKYNIDFCCGGKIPLLLACEKYHVNFQEVVRDLEGLTFSSETPNDYNTWELDTLVEYILNEYHIYTVEALNLLIQYGQKVVHAHGTEHPETILVHDKMIWLHNDLMEHMKKEENILFPYIKKLVIAKNGGEFIIPPFRTIKNPIIVMDKEHIDAGDILKGILDLTGRFTLPEGVCNTYRAYYTKLQEFQNKTFEHIHIENNILFPRAIELENTLIAI